MLYDFESPFIDPESYPQRRLELPTTVDSEEEDIYGDSPFSDEGQERYDNYEEEDRIGFVDTEFVVSAREHASVELLDAEDIDDDVDQEEIFYGEEDYLNNLDDEVDLSLEEAYFYEDEDEDELSDLEYKQEIYGEAEAPYMEAQINRNRKNSLLPRMKFEFQTSNQIWRSDGRNPPSLLPRKYGPKDFLVDEKGVRLESETKGVLEFETEWIRKWSALEKAITRAVKMTDAMNDSDPSKFESSRKAFPFDVAHLRTGSRNEKMRGFWNRKKGTEGKNEKILGEKEELEVKLTDQDINGHSKWEAAIQSSECFLLHQYETYLRQHHRPELADIIIEEAKNILDAVRPQGTSATQFVNLNSFLQLVVYYITQGQQINVMGEPSKFAFGLMSRTNFSSIFRRLLRRDERRLFYKIIRNNEILKEKGLNRRHPFFIGGYGRKKHQSGPTVYNWLLGIYRGKDLLSARSGRGLSASMGRYNVENRKSRKDRWLVKFETRGTIMGRVVEARNWVSYASKLHILASKRRRRPVSWILLPLGNKAELFLDHISAGDERIAISIAHQQGVIDEDKLTNLVFHSYYPELVGRRIQKKERALAQKWLRVRSDLVRPFLQSSASHEVMEFASDALSDEVVVERFIDDSEMEAYADFFPDALDEFTDGAQSHDAKEVHVAEAYDEIEDDFVEFEEDNEELTDELTIDELTFNEGLDGESDDEFDEEAEIEELVESETGVQKRKYNRMLKIALRNLNPAGFSTPWRSATYDRAAGKHDTKYWRVVSDPIKKGRHMLEIKSDIKAFEAVRSLLSREDRWTFECASFIQAVHLYALARSRGRRRFLRYFTTKKLNLRFFGSSGLITVKYYRKGERGKTWRVKTPTSITQERISEADLLRQTPFGARVMWHNVKGEGAWENENTVKVGNNRYRGFPLFSAKPVKGWKIKMGLAAHQVYKSNKVILERTLEDIEKASGADIVNNSTLQKLWQYTRRNVYLREVKTIGPDPAM